MATLEKIRSKAAMLVVVIGIALLAFIIGDFLNSGQSFFMMNQNKVATVNGTAIGVEEYQERVNARTEQMQAMYQQNGMSMPDGMSATIQMEVYDQMVSEKLMTEELEAVGIAVSDAELQDMLTGNNIHPEIVRSFTDPQTGIFDRQALDNYLSVIFNPEENGYTEPAQLEQIAMQRQAWLDMEEQIRQARAYEKFMNLLNAAVMPNKVDAEMAFAAQTKSVDVAYAVQPYMSVADSTVEVSKSDLQAEYNKLKARYETPEVRTIRYIAVDVVPSADDYAKVEEKINMVQAQFATSDDVATVVDNNSDVPYEDVFVAVSSMPADMKNFVETAKVGDATEPAFANDAYTMYRLMDAKTAPDTVTVSLVSFAMGDTRIDSVYNVLAAGTAMDALGADVNVTKEFAVTEGMYNNLGRQFVNDVFAAGNGYFKTESFGGVQHIAKVVKRSAPVAKAKVATMTIGVAPSVDTETNLYNALSSYVAKYNNAQQFVDSAYVAGYTIMPADCQATQASVPGMKNSRQIVHWAFNAKKGEISEIFEVDDRYVVAVVEKIVKEGYRPMEDMETMLTSAARRTKKAAVITEQLAAVTPATLEAYATAMNASVDTAKFVSMASLSVAGLGYEPAVVGVASGLEAGVVSAPVVGNRGVYVLQVVNENPVSRPYNEDAEMSRLQQQYTGAANQFLEVLKEKADIENTLVRFF
ncbi:MAG: SurA N-terminal domain-containing protein [Bacteroidaceae bacterium]|nr:SurA N-terminal domain-containing protein [Bacteroidaceae bacterium]